MSSLLDRLSHRKSFQKQAKQTEATAPKHKKHLPKKTIQIDYKTYRRLKIESAIKNMQLGKIASKSINYCLDHKIFH